MIYKYNLLYLVIHYYFTIQKLLSFLGLKKIIEESSELDIYVNIKQILY